MSDFVYESCESFIQKLAGKDPVPGGGGASALVAAIGTALGNMAGALTIGKKKYIDVEEDILELMSEAERLRQKMLDLVQRDAEVFAPLVKAYGMPKETEDQLAEKIKVMEAALREACGVPLEIMESCCRGIELCAEFAEKGSKLAISDSAAGATLCKAALQSASLNVYINTKEMTDRLYAEKANRQADKMLDRYTKLADQILESVLKSLT